MTNKMFKVLRCLIILFCMSPSCASHRNSEIDFSETAIVPQTDDGCITPGYTFAYPTNLRESNQRERQEILPKVAWQFVLSLPELPKNTGSHDTFLMAQTRNGHTELWLRRSIFYTGEQSGTPSIAQIVVYRDDLHRWSGGNEHQSEVSITQVFQQTDGSIWGLGYSASLGGYELFKFHQQENQFMPVPNSGMIPIGKIVFDPMGVFWIFVASDAIYRFDIAEMELQRSADISDVKQLPFDDGITLAPDGNIYFLKPKQDVIGTQDLELIRFSTITEDIEREILILLAPRPAFISLFADHSNRLWFSDIGWMTLDRKFYQTIRPAIFLEYSPGQDFHYDYYPWVSTTIVMESTNHLLWFRSENGMTWLDPAEGKWCWFTTLQNADLIEDQQSIIWMVADGMLYKHLF